ncbi:hypothetical protein [Spirosoma radiotolerans]|uniref:Uncharacterized protein n=1 Tax=Spirosoma radiotolerans TaxID=1379870 RepID=A0A0E3ZTR8_9BACT|nr:hypothetical protein [Spirosoma radiotolerans]AKD54088.1 hypothetical protein SD10_03405 [Spirosoma radiotolerans]
MPAVSRGIVYSLLAVVVVLLLGIAALISVASQRNQRLKDATIDFQRNLNQKEGKIKDLQQRLENCDTVRATISNDSGWGPASISTDTTAVVSQTVSSPSF